MKIPIFSQLVDTFRQANQWLSKTPERALDEAYQAALKIKAIEDEYFEGKRIAIETKDYGDNTMAFFLTDLKKYLQIAKVRLTEFKASRSVINLSEEGIFADKNRQSSAKYPRNDLDREQPSILLEKLNFIDEIIDKYSRRKKYDISSALITVPQSTFLASLSMDENGDRVDTAIQKATFSLKDSARRTQSFANKTGVLPRSILRTIDRLQKDLDPRSEQEAVKNFRSSQAKTVISIKLILILMLVPLLAQQVSKNIIFSPLIDKAWHSAKIEIFLNVDLKEEAFVELERFEKELNFKSLIGLTPKLSAEEKEEKVKEKAAELAEEYQHRSSDAIKNICADVVAIIVFAGVIVNRQKDIAVFKSFIDNVVYGLSDSAKAFIIILFTDVFVGFHSSHGWEVLLEGISRHLGIPENRQLIFLFIATFPVILDTMIKYWIFRYLNGISPSAVATYKNMNE
jgi:hypothetical protein